jgi:hypothetical protein
MSSKILTLGSFNASAVTGAAVTKIAIPANTLRCILQAAFVTGGEIIGYEVSSDNIVPNTPVQVDLCEVDVPATGGTGSFIPISYLTTAIAATGTTTLVVASQLQPTGGPTNFTIAVLPQPGLAAAMEQILITQAPTGTGPYTYSLCQRGINNTAPLASIPVNSAVFAVPGGGAVGDIVPVSALPPADPSWATCALGSPWLGSAPATALTGFNFTATYPTTVKNLRMFDSPQVPPTTPFVYQQFPEQGWEFSPGRFVQLRITAANAVNVSASITFKV